MIPYFLPIKAQCAFDNSEQLGQIGRVYGGELTVSNETMSRLFATFLM